MSKLTIPIIAIIILAGISSFFPVFQKPAFSQPFQRPAGTCGNEICDQLEKENPNLCPKDCDEAAIQLTQSRPINQKGNLDYQQIPNQQTSSINNRQFAQKTSQDEPSAIQSIVILYPKKGETWQTGNIYKIKWSDSLSRLSGFNEYAIQLIRNNALVGVIGTTKAKEFSWEASKVTLNGKVQIALPGPDYFIQIVRWDEKTKGEPGQIAGISDTFSIVGGKDLSVVTFTADSSVSKQGMIKSFFIEPSRKDGGWVLYKDGAKAVMRGENLQRAEIRYLPTGTGMSAEFPKGKVLGSLSKVEDTTWELVLQKFLLTTNFWVEAVDVAGRIIKGPDLGHVGYEEATSPKPPSQSREQINKDSPFGASGAFLRPLIESDSFGHPELNNAQGCDRSNIFCIIT